MQQDNSGAAPFFEGIVCIKFSSSFAIKTVKISNRKIRDRIIFAKINKMLNQHPKRRTPIADVIPAQHLVAYKLQNSTQRIPNDGGAKVSDMHFFRYIRG